MSFCFLCCGELPSSFATVLKDGKPVQVHYGCRIAAEDLIALNVPVQDNPDTFVTTLPIG
jgi:hypothetical protein